MAAITTQKDYPHGTHARYVFQKCRCAECRNARRLYEQKRTVEHILRGPLLVDAAPTRAHIKKLMSKGMGYKRIAKKAGVPTSVVGNLVWGRKDRAARKLRRETARKILAVSLDYAGGAKVPKAEALEIIDELVARGWTKVAIGKRVHGPQAKSLQVGKGKAAVFASTLVVLRQLLTEPVPMRVYSRGPGGPKLMPPTKKATPKAVRPKVVGVAVPEADQIVAERKAVVPELIADLLRDGEWWTINQISWRLEDRGEEAVRRAVWRMVRAGELEKRQRELTRGFDTQFRLTAGRERA